jgi:hypothetical protein
MFASRSSAALGPSPYDTVVHRTVTDRNRSDLYGAAGQVLAVLSPSRRASPCARCAAIAVPDTASRRREAHAFGDIVVTDAQRPRSTASRTVRLTRLRDCWTIPPATVPGPLPGWRPWLSGVVSHRLIHCVVASPHGRRLRGAGRQHPANGPNRPPRRRQREDQRCHRDRRRSVAGFDPRAAPSSPGPGSCCAPRSPPVRGPS